MTLIDRYGSLTRLRPKDVAYLQIQGEAVLLTLKRGDKELKRYNLNDPLQALQSIADCCALQLGRQISGNNTIIVSFQKAPHIKDRIRAKKRT